jgi:hypothetical protein
MVSEKYMPDYLFSPGFSLFRSEKLNHHLLPFDAELVPPFKLQL